MAKETSPHTQSQKCSHFAQSDANPEELEQNVGTGSDGETYDNRDGAQTGSGRSPRHSPDSSSPPNSELQPTAFEGGLQSRVIDDDAKQGISVNSSAKEAAGQRKVVNAREDAQAGVDHSGRASR